MSKWKCGICGNEFENFYAQGFNGIIYCPLCYFKEDNRRKEKSIKKAINCLNKFTPIKNTKIIVMTKKDKNKIISILKGGKQ